MDLKYMPINMNMNNRKCLVVGGGNVAMRKIETLLNYETSITVIAPEVIGRFDYYAEKGMIIIEKREYKSPEAQDYGLVISASDDEEVNRSVSDDCRKAGVPVNVVDNPKLCDFIFPATFHRDCLSISIATDGQAPFLAGGLRSILEHSMFEQKRWTTIAQLAAIYRNRVKKQYPEDTRNKMDAFGRFLETDWQKVLKEVPDEALSDYIDTLLLEPVEENNDESDENKTDS